MQTEYLLTMPGGSEWLFIILFLAYLVFWVKALFEIASSTEKHQATKVTWFLIVLFLNLPGLLIYYLWEIFRKTVDINRQWANRN